VPFPKATFKNLERKFPTFRRSSAELCRAHFEGILHQVNLREEVKRLERKILVKTTAKRL
jgi:hypothetical protein